jgi:hypothetical protein
LTAEEVIDTVVQYENAFLRKFLADLDGPGDI